MIINDYLSDISEKQMFKFLENCFGPCLDAVIRYYDDSYGGYLFKVQLNGGIDYLPNENKQTGACKHRHLAAGSPAFPPGK